MSITSCCSGWFSHTVAGILNWMSFGRFCRSCFGCYGYDCDILVYNRCHINYVQGLCLCWLSVVLCVPEILSCISKTSVISNNNSHPINDAVLTIMLTGAVRGFSIVAIASSIQTPLWLYPDQQSTAAGRQSSCSGAHSQWIYSVKALSFGRSNEQSINACKTSHHLSFL